MYAYLLLLYSYDKAFWFEVRLIYCLWIPILLLPALLPRLRGEKTELKLMLLFAGWVILTRILCWNVKELIEQLRSGDFSFSADALLIASSVVTYVPLASCLILRGRDRDRFLNRIAIVSVSFSTIVGLICLYGVLYKTDMLTPFRERYLCMFKSARLYPLGQNPNVGCMWFFLGFFYTAYLFCCTKKRTCRAVLVFAAFLNYLMLAMTFSRNGKLSFSVCTGLLVLVLVLRRLSPKTVGKKLLCTVLVLGLTVPLAYGSFRLAASGVESASSAMIQHRNNAQTQPEGETNGAGTEMTGSAYHAAPAVLREKGSAHADAQARTVSQILRTDDGQPFAYDEDDRGFRDSGRIPVYKSAIYTLQQDPIRLLIGCRGADVMKYSDEVLPVPMPHFHNAFLQVLCTTGVVGLVLVLIFCVLLGRRVIRVLYSDAPVTVSILALMLVGIFSYYLLESGLFLSSNIVCFTAYIAAGVVIDYTCEHGETTPAAAACTGKNA